jgi:hypothetical protein
MEAGSLLGVQRDVAQPRWSKRIGHAPTPKQHVATSTLLSIWSELGPIDAARSDLVVSLLEAAVSMDQSAPPRASRTVLSRRVTQILVAFLYNLR